MPQRYEYALAVTSQFYFCSLPIRLDPFSHCTFGCVYCFASARGGNRDGKYSVIEPRQFEERLRRVLRQGDPKSVLDEFIAQRIPVHLGGMTDPLSSLEANTGTTLRILEALALHNYPTIISTKSDLFAQEPYLEVLEAGRFTVQCSMSSTDDDLLKNVDCGTPGPSRLLRAAAITTDRGIPVSVRAQPLLPGREDDAFEVIDNAATAGVFHVGVEHLKLPLERGWWGTDVLSEALSMDLREYFAEAGASRVGREWILPLDSRLPRVLEMRDFTHSRSMTFGAADTDLLPLGDGGCCCSGVDLLEGWNGYHFKHNYAEAVRRADSKGRITYGSIQDEWIPGGSIARWVNSRSRIPTNDDTGVGASMQDYILRNWSGSPNGPMPGLFAGVSPTSEVDSSGMTIYKVDPAIQQQMSNAQRSRDSDS